MPARYLRQRDIDRRAWDEAVARDATRLPYGHSWWLDQASVGRWDGIVLDDYRAVLPLPRGRFWARTQVQRPFFTQQCGPFGKLEDGDLGKMIAQLPARLATFDLGLAETADPAGVPPTFRAERRTNYVLPLSADYASLRAGYRKELVRKLKPYAPAAPAPCLPGVVARVHAATVGDKANLKRRHYRRAIRLMQAALDHRAGLCLHLTDEAGDLLAVVFLLHYRRRLVNLLPASTPVGYERAGMARLLDGVVRQYGPTCDLLDFEGSDVPGVARFFRSFGATDRGYTRLYR